MKLNTAAFDAKFYLNGFPKAGLHLLDLLCRQICMPMPYDSVWNTPWAGMYKGNSWTLFQVRLREATFKMGRVQPGHFMKGHMGFHPDIETFMYFFGLNHIFIYRDLRDVATSQVYHILSDEDAVFSHKGKEALQALGGFDEILEAVLVGFGEPDPTQPAVSQYQYPGLLERWEHYVPWFNYAWESGQIDRYHWLLPIKFEDIVGDRVKMGKVILDYVFSRMEFILNLDPAQRQVTEEQLTDIATEMAWKSTRTGASPTFRKGLTGEWRSHFKDYHKDLFKELDTGNWLVKLGYEEDKNW